MQCKEILIFCHRVAFCQTTFYYRQDNPLALTKVFRPHFIEDIYGYVALLEFMRNNSLDRKFIKEWYKCTVNLVFHYRSTVE